MTLAKFQRLLRKVNPKLTIRIRGREDCGGIFAGRFGKSGYIARLSKGELHLRGFRYAVVDPQNPMRLLSGKIRKRGRKTLIILLRDRRWIKNHKQVSMLLWGIGGDKNGRGEKKAN